MTDSEGTRLCIQVIQSHFGSLSAKVASVLLNRGRLSISQLIRFCQIKPRTVRASLLVLIQHNLVWHLQSEEEGEVVEFNADECLLRLRFGRFAWLAGQLFGHEAKAIVSLILDHGKLRHQDVISRLSGADAKVSKLYEMAFSKLLSGTYLRASTDVSHVSPRDRLLKYEFEERSLIKGLPTAKQLREVQERALARLKGEEGDISKLGMPKGELLSHKLTKRKVLSEDSLDVQLYFRVNYPRFNIHLRNKLIVKSARERLNDGAAGVLEATLNAAEGKKPEMSDIRSESVTIQNISMHINDNHSFRTGLMKSSKSSSIAMLVKDYVGILAAADNPSPHGRAGCFLSTTSGTSGKVQVEFSTICRKLRICMLESVVRERHGDDAVRIMRILLETGKMDEKHLAKVAMMSHKDVRPLLSDLSNENLVSLQEVPKGNDRNPTRTFYLWYVDLNKAYKVLLRSFYKSLFNVMARLQAESNESLVKSVLEKCARVDVANDENLLSKAEQDILNVWQVRRDRLYVMESRIEEAIFVLWDLNTVTGD